VIHLHGAVAIDEDERAALVVERRGERDAEFRGRDGEPALHVLVLRVEGGDLRAAGAEIARPFQLPPDRADALRVGDDLPVMGGLALAVEIALADLVRADRQPLRGLREDVLDRHHRLRPAEAAERGLRGLVRPAHAAGRLEVRHEVGVVAVEERPPHDRLRQVEAPPSVGEERQLQRLELAR